MSIKIDQALTQGFIDGAFGVQIAHENVNFEPTGGTPWVRLTVFRNPAAPDTMGSAGKDETIGLFQATLHYPEGEYAVTAKQKADEIMAAFAIGTKLSYDDQEVLITKKDRGTGYNEDGWFKLNLRFTYNARTERNAA